MISDDNNGLPTSIAGVFGVALGLYARRIVFYGTLALVALAIEIVVNLAVLNDTGLELGLDLILESFLVAAVSIGVAFDLAHKPADWSLLFTTASLRWGVVALMALITVIFFDLFAADLLQPTQDNGFGFYTLPIIVIWGALSLSTVVAAIEPVKSRLTLPLVSLGKALAVSSRFVNLGRLVMLSAVMLIPYLLEVLLTKRLMTAHVFRFDFWGSAPIEVLTAGPMQALMTVFYVDFLRRAKR